MDSFIDIPFHQKHQSQNPNSGLLRFCSAPSSLLSNFRDSLDKKYDYNQTSRLATAGGDDSFGSIESKSLRVPQNGYSDSGSRMIGMQCQLPCQYPKESVVITSEAIGGSYKVDGSAMDQSTEGKTVVGSNLDRHSSSPAGLLAHLDPKNGHNMMIGSRSFRIGSDTVKESSPPTSRLIGQIDFASGLSSSMLILQRIPPNENENDKCNCEKFINGEGNVQFYSPGLAFTSWNDTASLVDSTPEDRADQRNNRVLYSCLDESIAQACNQNDGLQTQTSWSHQVSLPNTSAVMAAMEKLLHFQDAVPCKIRAKRGCTTHPRSIAERVRRTQISERMKKLQELVPNIEKQMNTIDMLDLAVEYIKDLQEQHKALSDNRAKCQCSNVQKSAANNVV